MPNLLIRNRGAKAYTFRSIKTEKSNWNKNDANQEKHRNDLLRRCSQRSTTPVDLEKKWEFQRKTSSHLITHAGVRTGLHAGRFCCVN